MIRLRKLIIAIIGGLVVTAAGHADMVSVSRTDAEPRQPARVCGRTDLQHTNLANPLNCTGVADLDLWSAGSLPEADADAGQTSQIQPPQTLTNGPSSLSLCLSAMIGLGLCSSAHWVKRISFGFVPEWYHNGGPFQIGHSLAVSPDSLCPVPAYCFIQPVRVVERLIPQYRLGTVVSLWRKSQFTPDVIASRGPPSMS